MTEGITIAPMAETKATPADLAALFNDAFGDYDGIIRATPETMAWYLGRPGLGAEHVFLALAGDKPVGGAMVTVAPVVLGGSALPCGIVDSVMTRPEWRRRGIASGLMEYCLAWMRAQDLAASLLYTAHGSGGHRLYTRLGFRNRATCYYFYSRPAPVAAPDPDLRPAMPEDAGRVCALLNAGLGDRDGFVPMDDALWQWRRETRPPAFPCTVFALDAGGRLIGTGALCSAKADVSGQPVELTVLADIAGETPAAQERVLRGLLAQIPPGHAAGLVSGSNDRVLPRLAERLHMERHEEVAMVLPLNEAGASALRHRVRGWYTLSESLLGV